MPQALLWREFPVWSSILTSAAFLFHYYWWLLPVCIELSSFDFPCDVLVKFSFLKCWGPKECSEVKLSLICMWVLKFVGRWGSMFLHAETNLKVTFFICVLLKVSSFSCWNRFRQNQLNHYYKCEYITKKFYINLCAGRLC